MIKIKGSSPEGKFKTGKIVYIGKLTIKQPVPPTGLYPRHDLFPANNLYPIQP